MSSPGKSPIKGRPLIIGHVLYKYNRITDEIFLQKKQHCGSMDVFFGGKKITTQQTSKELRELLSKRGFKFETSNKTHSVFRHSVAGVKIDGVKHKKGETVVELLIRVPANTVPDLHKKMETLIRTVEKSTGIKPIEAATWEKGEDC